jgi:hypothetical protein
MDNFKDRLQTLFRGIGSGEESDLMKVLNKMRKVGHAGLTKEEQQILLKSSMMFGTVSPTAAGATALPAFRQVSPSRLRRIPQQLAAFTRSGQFGPPARRFAENLIDPTRTQALLRMLLGGR